MNDGTLPSVLTPQNPRLVSPGLASLLEGYRDEVVASWVKLLYALDDTAGEYPSPRYRERPVTEVQSNTRLCLSALATLFRTGSLEQLAQYTEHICETLVGHGFDVAEVIRGHMLLKDAVAPVIERESRWETDEDQAAQMLDALDGAIRWLVIRLSKLYSQTISTRLEQQVALLGEQRQQLERRVREVSALIRSSMLITSTLDLDRVLGLILEQLAEVVEYDRATVQLLIDGRLRIIAGKGFLHPEEVVGTSFDPGENPLTRRLLRGLEPVILSDVSQEPSFVTDPGDPTHSWIGVPLMFRDEVIGALALDKREPSYYDHEVGQTVLAFANQAAIAIQNARLYDRSREQDILAERNRLARELHDSLSQALFSMVLNAEAARLFFDTDADKAKAQIDILHETANTALKEMRALIFELRPANLEQEGLVAVLKKHAKMVSERQGLRVSVEALGQRRLELTIEKALFRVAQEALNNVVKHARATEAQVVLNNQDNWVTMSVTDNGVGFEPGHAKANTLGLTSMRERVEQLGGTIEIGPGPGGKGTTVRVRVPCEK